jgi:hypothetical protein
MIIALAECADEDVQRKKKIKDNVKVSKRDDNLVKGGEEWLMKYFSRSATILPINKIKSETGLACIMDSPEVHMAFEYIEETYLKEAMDVLSDVLCQESGPRTKDVIITVRGSGGGKTRMLEEIRRKVNERYDGVAIAVTFNNLTDYDMIKEKFIINHDHHEVCGEMNIILSIICRLCCIIYGYSFEESVLQMKNIQLLDS